MAGEYKAWLQLEKDVPLDLHFGDLLQLPPSALHTSQASLRSGKPMFLSLAPSAVSRPEKRFVASVGGFEAEEGHIRLPGWLQQALDIPVGGRVLVERLVDDALPDAERCRLRATDPRFMALPNARAVLETALSTHFRTLTQGTVIPIRHLGGTYQLHVEELEPARSCALLDIELEVDLQGPISGDVQGPSADDKPLEVPVGHAEGVTASAGRERPTVFHFQVPMGQAFDVVVRAMEGDVEAYLGDEDLPQATRLYHTYTLDGDMVGGGVIAVKPDHRSNDWYLSVKAYGAASQCKASISVLPSGDTNAVEAQEEQSTSPAGKLQACGNCGEAVPVARLSLHQAYCERHNTRCGTCARVIRRAQLAQHWHCDQCVETTVVCDSEEAKRKHLDIYHQPMTCECGAAHELRAMQKHKREACPSRTVICRFCFNHLPAGAPPEDASDRARGLTAHEAVCGSRTEKCAACGKRIRLKDMELHQRLHETGAFGGSVAPSAAGSSSGQHQSGSSTYVARPLSPTSLRRARNAAWARAGFSPIESTSPVDGGPSAVRSAGPAPAFPLEDDSFRRAAAASLAESGPGQASSEAAPTGVCANTLCPRERPAEADFCLRCAPKMGQARLQNAKVLIGALVKRYFQQLTSGCGLSGCENTWCCSGGKQEPFAPQAAAIEALRLARLGLDGDIRLCLDTPEEYSHRHALDALVAMGFSAPYCARALHMTGNDADAAATWLINRGEVATH